MKIAWDEDRLPAEELIHTQLVSMQSKKSESDRDEFDEKTETDRVESGGGLRITNTHTIVNAQKINSAYRTLSNERAVVKRVNCVKRDDLTNL